MHVRSYQRASGYLDNAHAVGRVNRMWHRAQNKICNGIWTETKHAFRNTVFPTTIVTFHNSSNPDYLLTLHVFYDIFSMLRCACHVLIQ